MTICYQCRKSEAQYEIRTDVYKLDQVGDYSEVILEMNESLCEECLSTRVTVEFE